MAQKLDIYRARVIAEAYFTNGFKKSAALQAADYSKSYSVTNAALKLFKHKLVIEALDEISARNAIRTDLTCEMIENGWRDIAWPAEGVHVQNSDKNAALNSLAKAKGMFVERNLILTAELETPEQLSESDLASLRDMAKMVTGKSLSGPQIVPGPLEESLPVIDVQPVRTPPANPEDDEIDRLQRARAELDSPGDEEVSKPLEKPDPLSMDVCEEFAGYARKNRLEAQKAIDEEYHRV